jgi:hypothetical protein
MNIDFVNPLVLQRIIFWMDGGSISLDFLDADSRTINIQFTQTMSLKKYPFTPIPKGMYTPGSLVYNEEEVPVRSDMEKQILKALEGFQFGAIIPSEGIDSTRKTVKDCIDFVKSDRYLQIASEMGRI